MADICTNFTVPIDLNPKFDIIWSFDYCILGEVDSSAGFTTFLYQKGGDLNQGGEYSSLGYGPTSSKQGMSGGYVCIALDSDDLFSKPLNRPAYAPFIKKQPRSGTAPLDLTVEVKGTAPLSYQWYRNGDAILGATNPSYRALIDGMYRVQISNSVGSIKSNEVYVVAYPFVKRQPIGGDYPKTLSLELTGTPPFEYQWYKNGVEIDEDGDKENLFTSEEGDYKVKITNFAGSIFSNIATVTIPIISPTILIHPTNGYPNKTLTVTASGTEPFIYEWYKNGALIFGESTSSYKATVEGRYKVKVSNISGFQYSNDALITTAPVAPTITLQPIGGEVPIELTVNAVGTAPLTYKWIKDDLITVGSNKNYLATDGAKYKVVVSNFVGSVTSNSVDATNIPPLPIIVTHPESGNLPKELYVAATSIIDITYQWYKNGNIIIGATNNTYTPTTTGTYKVSVTNTTGTVYSNDAVVSPAVAVSIVSFTGPEYFNESATINPSANTYIIEFDRLVKLKDNNFKQAFADKNVNVKNIIPIDASGGLAKKYKIETLRLDEKIPSYGLLNVKEAEMTPTNKFKLVASDKIKNLNEINLNYKIHNIPPTTSPNIDLLNVGSNSLINLGGCTNSDHYTDPYIKWHSIIFINTTKLNYLSKLSRFDSDDKKSTTILWEGVFEYDGKNTEVNMIWECTTFKDYPYRFEIKTHPEKWIKKKIDDKYPLNQIRKTASDAAYLNFDFDAGKSYTIEYCYSVSIPENICEDQYGTTNIAYSKAATSLVFK